MGAAMATTAMKTVAMIVENCIFGGENRVYVIKLELVEM